MVPTTAADDHRDTFVAVEASSTMATTTQLSHNYYYGDCHHQVPGNDDHLHHHHHHHGQQSADGAALMQHHHHHHRHHHHDAPGDGPWNNYYINGSRHHQQHRISYSHEEMQQPLASDCGRPQLAHEIYARLLVIAAAAGGVGQQRLPMVAPTTAAHIRLAAFTGCPLAFSRSTTVARSLDDDDHYNDDDNGNNGWNGAAFAA